MASTITSGNTVVTSPVVQFVGPDVILGSSNGSVSFFGKTPVVQIPAASVTDFATLKVALQNIGLIGP